MGEGLDLLIDNVNNDQTELEFLNNIDFQMTGADTGFQKGGGGGRELGNLLTPMTPPLDLPLNDVNIIMGPKTNVRY